MGFLVGRVSYFRFRVDGPKVRQFGEDHIERLADFQAGRQRIASADGVEVGWTAGSHILDTDFQLGKNIVNDSLCFELAVDSERLPADRLRAYYEVELKALSANNPSGLPSAKQKREAREIARERIEDEAKDGRYRKRVCTQVLWDAKSNEVLFGTTSLTQVERLVALFRQSFGYTLDPITAGRRAELMSELNPQSRSIDDLAPSAFVPGFSPDDVAWIADDASKDFLGNEFILWLWHQHDAGTDTVTLTDGTEATFMLARTLGLDCPRGQTGSETIKHEGPTSLPEAKRAIQSGKLPRKTGITLVRHNEQYEFTLHAETLAVGSTKMPAMAEDVVGTDAKLNARVDQIRHFVQSLDLLYGTFVAARCKASWSDQVSRISKWLQGVGV